MIDDVNQIAEQTLWLLQQLPSPTLRHTHPGLSLHVSLGALTIGLGAGEMPPSSAETDGQRKKVMSSTSKVTTWSQSTHSLIAFLGLEKRENGAVCWSKAVLGGPSPTLEGNQLKRAVSDGTKARQSTYSCFQANM